MGRAGGISKTGNAEARRKGKGGNPKAEADYLHLATYVALLEATSEVLPLPPLLLTSLGGFSTVPGGERHALPGLSDAALERAYNQTRGRLWTSMLGIHGATSLP